MTTAADPAIYPAPRKRAGGLAAGEVPPSFNPPRTRVFPFFLQGALATRRSISTPRLHGPAIIKDLRVNVPSGASPPNGTVEIGIAPNDVSEDGVATTVQKPYTILTEFLDPFGLVSDLAGQGFPNSSALNATSGIICPLDLIVTDAEFRVVIAWSTTAAVNPDIAGHVRVIENVDPEALSFFL